MLFLSFLLLCCYTFHTEGVPSNQSYWVQREALVKDDLNQLLGHDIVLTPDEEIVNSILMQLKNDELEEGIKTLEFLASKQFVESKTKIDQSPVFQFIQNVPKGGLLHTHDMAMTSVNWVISTLTYWDDLYMCLADDGALSFKFFDTPDETCKWDLVADARANAPSQQDFDDFIFSKLSLFTDDVQSTYPDINSIWKAFEGCFGTISGLVMYREAWVAYFSRALEEFMNDNVSYLEFRGVLLPLYEKSGKEYSTLETLEIYENIIQNFISKNSDRFFGVRFIYAPPRSANEEKAWQYVDLVSSIKTSFPSLVAGFDLVGQEDLGNPLTFFIDPLLTLASHDPPVQFFFHSGETNWQGVSTDGNLYDAILLNATRLGHGFAITKHPKIMEMARERDIAIELCPISNQILKLVTDLRNHPGSPLAANSFPVVVSSDDPAMWEASPLSHDFYEFFMAMGGAKADLRTLKKLALNSIRYSSMDGAEKEKYQQLWEPLWDAFIQQQIANLK